MPKISKNNLWLQIITFFVLLPNISIVKAAGLDKAFSNAKDVATTTYNTSISVETVVSDVISTVLALIGVLFVVLMISAGFEWMTAAGNETKVDKARSIIKTSFIGLLIVIAAYAITYFVTATFSSQLRN